jgi:hypothetical protein
MSKILSRLFPPPNKGANQNSSPEKARESMTNEKNQPNPELKRPKKPQPSPGQRATGFRAPLQFPNCSLSFLSNKSYFIHRLWLIIQLPHKPVLWPVKARTLDTIVKLTPIKKKNTNKTKSLLMIKAGCDFEQVNYVLWPECF